MRKIFLALGAVLAMVVMGLSFAQTAEAHIEDHSATCEGFALNLTAYPEGSHVKVTIDGDVKADQDFTPAFSYAQSWSQYTGHTWAFVVKSGDNNSRYDRDMSGSVDACKELTPVTPVVPTATEPTCDTDGVLTIPEQPEGVTATVDHEGTGPGTYTFTFTADEGYVLAEGVESTFTITVGAATGDCETTPPPTTPPTTVPTPTETTTTTTITLPPVTTQVPPSNTPRTLPNTGAGSVPVLPIGLGLLVAMIIALTMFLRRSTGQHE